MEHSESIKELATALAKAQGEMGGAKKGSANPFFKSKYADLAEVWEACREPLSTNGLAIIQTTAQDEKGVTVETILAHTSGEWISGKLSMVPVKNDPQGIGSIITYARRYSLSAIVGIAPEDDDAEKAMGRDHKTSKSQAEPLSATSTEDVASELPQKETFVNLTALISHCAKEFGIGGPEIFKICGVKTSTALMKYGLDKAYSAVVAWVDAGKPSLEMKV